MTFEQYWTILIKQWKIVVLCFLFVGVGTFIGSKLMTPIYQSTALVQVDIRSSSNNQADYNSLLASDQLVQTEAALATGDPVLREVASHYPNLPMEQLVGEVSSTVRTNTQLFEIDVVDPSPTQAARLANDIAMTLITQQQQVLQQDNTLARQQIQQDLDTTSQQISDTTTKIISLQGNMKNKAQVAILQTKLNVLQQHYNQWQSALAQLELAQAQSGNFLRLAQPASPSIKPVRPNIPLYTVGGLLVGLLLGMLLAVLLEQLDTRVHTPEELTQLLGWPVLATVWRAESKEEELVNPVGHTANVESYRILRTNIGFSVLDKPLHTIMVTSAAPNDGKSTIAANLAIFMAKASKNTLLIDADLRRPTLHQKFHLSPDKMGLSNAVVAYSRLQPITDSAQQFLTSPYFKPSLDVYMHDAGYPNLRVVPSGPLPPNPPDVLDSKAMERLFTSLTDCGAEVVIFDTPPVLGLSDTSILASKVDGAVVVVDITRTKKKNLLQMKGILTQAGTHVLGCVINKQARHRKDTTYSYYYYYRAGGGDHEMKNGNEPVAALTAVQSPQSKHRTKSHRSFLGKREGA
jgi:Mrp family chromosome partitioning ATPase/capsular polysaccharide biosynthesis protein